MSDISQLFTNNPDLLLDGIARKQIGLSHIPGVIPVGAGQPNEFVTSFLGGPYIPVNYAFNPNTLSGLSFGGNGYYPRPFLSYSQKLTNANYSYIGPYARLVKFVNTKCDPDAGPLCTNAPLGEIYGRLGIIPDGLGSGSYGFFISPWHSETVDGTYDAGFWSERFNIDPPIPDKPTWWDQCSKTTVIARFYNHPTRQHCIVEIAYNNLEFDSDQYFPGMDAGSLGDASLDMLVVFVGLAAAVRWL
jgi:hypothetical protein